EQAETAQPDSCHHGFGGGFFEDRGLRMAKWVYSFGNGTAEGRAEMRDLLGSVRSGARASMPGMMDTVLNLGLNDRTVLGLAKSSGDERFAWDSYRRFIQMYSNVVLDVGHHYFEEALELKKEDLGVHMDTDL